MISFTSFDMLQFARFHKQSGLWLFKTKSLSCEKLYHCNSYNLINGSTCSMRSCSTRAKSAGLNVFDRNAKMLQRHRAAVRDDAHVFQYLKDEVGFRLSDRIFDIKKEFEVGIDLGCGRGNMSKHLTDVSL